MATRVHIDRLPEERATIGLVRAMANGALGRQLLISYNGCMADSFYRAPICGLCDKTLPTLVPEEHLFCIEPIDRYLDDSGVAEVVVGAVAEQNRAVVDGLDCNVAEPAFRIALKKLRSMPRQSFVA